jgi:hypothetical protein
MKNLLKKFNLMLILIGTMFLFAVVAQASIFTVTNANDSGVGSLRQAVLNANNQAGKDFIYFNIPGSGVHKISLFSPLELFGVVEIEGYSQPGSQANTLPQGDNAVLLIELDGSLAVANASGLVVYSSAAGSTIRGLVINRFNIGIQTTPNGGPVNVEGCFIGTDPTGTIARPNTRAGIHLEQSTLNHIGGTSPAQRNLISGNGNCVNNTCAGAGIEIFDGSNFQTSNVIEGNFIGTDHTSQHSLGNTDGVLIAGSSLVTIGGVVAGAKNVISGNRVGIHVSSSDSVQIIGNYIGTNSPGVNPVGNTGVGVLLDGNSGGNIIGDLTPGAANVISGNGGAGISILTTGGGNAIMGNLIGTDFIGGAPIANGANGIDLQGSNTKIGGTQSGAGNLIANNVGAGIYVSNSTGNSILGNQIYRNSGLAIDLAPGGVTGNDLNDVDGGPNHTQNFPVITAAVSDGTQTTIAGTLNSSANTQFRIEFFATPTCGNNAAIGQTYIGFANLTTVGNDASFTVTLQGSYLGQYLTATATATVTSDTSEFSACQQVTALVLPGVSISDVSKSEGNQGSTNFDFAVTLSSAPILQVTVSYLTASGSATSGVDFQPISGVLIFKPGETNKTVSVPVNGDTQVELNETFFVQLSNPVNATLSKAQGTGTIVNDDSVAPPTVQFNAVAYAVQEDLTAATITVMRSGDTSGTTTVDYTTADGTATQKGDYELTSGTLIFVPGDTTKTFSVLINEDSYVEGTETVTLTLSNPTGGASLGGQNTAVLNLTDDPVESVGNPNDDAQNFVYQQYHDLLNREPDAGGLVYWTSQITQCGNDQNCINARRKDLSAAFYIELEFQETGYFVYRMQKASYGTQPTYFQFMADRSRIDANHLKPGKQAFGTAWVQRAAFKAAYPDAMPQDQFVNKLYDTAGLVGYQTERLQAIQDLSNNVKSRAQVLRDAIEIPAFTTQEYNPSFVLMQYFGYLRRDADQGGYQFWLSVLNSQLPQDTSGYHSMVCAFVTSGEYQDRFSATHTHGNGECQ